MSKPWFRRRPPPRHSQARPVCWQGVALLIGGILLSGAPALLTPWFGLTAFLVWLLWFPASLAILFAMVARRTET